MLLSITANVKFDVGSPRVGTCLAYVHILITLFAPLTRAGIPVKLL